MTTHNGHTDANGFVRFFRNYTKTWIHAVATAGLTAFGTLTIVHNWFVILAIACYVVPPIVLYLRHGTARPNGDTSATDSGSTGDALATASESSSANGRDRGIPSSDSKRAGAREQADATTARGSETSASTTGTAETATTAETTETSDRTDTVDTESGSATAQQPAAQPGSEGRVEHAEPEPDDEPETDDVHKAEPAEADTPVATDTDHSESTGTDHNGATDEAATTEPADTRTEWNAVDTPTDATLRDVTVTGSNGGYAVGDGGTVLASDGHGEWSVVLEDGPAAGGNDLRGAETTADGEAVWVAGDSGALGRIAVETGRHTDYTAPEDITDNWLGVAVGGSSDAETILLINGSGAVLRGRYREGELEWTGPDKPGSGSSFSGIALADDGAGYCCDTNDGVFETTDGGESFERVGLEGADGTLTDVATAGRGDCLVSADDGVVHRYGGSTWTPERVADGSLTGLARSGERTVACVADGAVHERTAPAADWERIDTDASGALLAVSLDVEGGVAVGEDGAIIEQG